MVHFREGCAVFVIYVCAVARLQEQSETPFSLICTLEDNYETTHSKPWRAIIAKPLTVNSVLMWLFKNA